LIQKRTIEKVVGRSPYEKGCEFGILPKAVRVLDGQGDTLVPRLARVRALWDNVIGKVVHIMSMELLIRIKYVNMQLWTRKTQFSFCLSITINNTIKCSRFLPFTAPLSKIHRPVYLIKKANAQSN
jgi:hypothetical protein